MVLRRCPQCGSTCDDQYGFCIKCGFEFENIIHQEHQCPLCGFENPEEADFCVKCGTPLLFKNQFIAHKTGANPVIIKKTTVGNATSSTSGWMKWLVIFGYIFSVLGGLLGLIIAIYLITRKDATLRKHGIIQLAIFAFYIVLIGVFYFTGMIPPETFSNYKQLIMGNFTLP
ncbi:zinc-ribbon domain-containing protein [Methanobrevibacter sp.]|uniref:zinc ribbon domain-containing protein n=1 Tax=Methanobrevibacter sp. TaxID=66852 RepID=UPI00388F128A